MRISGTTRPTAIAAADPEEQHEPAEQSDPEGEKANSMSDRHDRHGQYQRGPRHRRRAASPREHAETMLQPVQILRKAFKWIHAFSPLPNYSATSAAADMCRFPNTDSAIANTANIASTHDQISALSSR